MSLSALLELSRKKLTPEELEALHERMRETDRRLYKEMIERFRCGLCGAGTYNYSHLFDCPRRGSGY
ncbi:hypothetical protein PHB09_168 [Pseudomonas phage PHB09]|uniref:Uncharacterized protein n=1 Tax=Pseudomonas phage PHB09 TaxID=2867265 RepID=A0AAE8XGN7_9CAUD|nr:hypothetical protein QGX10_gp167 [Pseudomonas phage PHB09]UAV84663.1 hypothetical protein PHB09_168 [Pseudomonas phage PHB09]